MKVKCWGAGDKGAVHARSRVGMTRQGDAEVEEVGQKVGVGDAIPWMGRYPYYRCDVMSE